MNSCRTVHELMEQARDERLPTLVQAAFDSHLGSCPDCARLAVLESGMNEGFAALRADDLETEVPSDFRRQVKERLLASDRSSLPAPAHWASGFTAGLAAAACMVLVAVAVFAMRGGLETESPAVIQASRASNSLPIEPMLLDSRTAPLLYSTPEVEVIYDGSRRYGASSQAMRPAAASADAEETERPKVRREYHF